MKSKIDPLHCQLESLPSLAKPAGANGAFQYLAGRLRRFVKRRMGYFNNAVRSRVPPAGRPGALPPDSQTGGNIPFQPGDWVWVRPKEDIRDTLDRWNTLRGCVFLEEMWPYCGTKQRVMKRLEVFLDERDYRLKKVRGTVLLEGVICSGTLDFGKCDRSCFFFWREEWLKKID